MSLVCHPLKFKLFLSKKTLISLLFSKKIKFKYSLLIICGSRVFILEIRYSLFNKKNRGVLLSE